MSRLGLALIHEVNNPRPLRFASLQLRFLPQTERRQITYGQNPIRSGADTRLPERIRQEDLGALRGRRAACQYQRPSQKEHLQEPGQTHLVRLG